MTLTQIKPAGLSTPVDLADNARIRLGTGNDLQIHHDGTNSFITNATNDLYINSIGDDLILKAADDAVIQVQGSENAVLCNGNGNVELYFDNSKKFETYAAGVEVNGNLYIKDGDSTVNRIALGTNGDLNLYHDGSNSLITNTTGVFVVKGDDYRIKSYSTDEEMIHAHVNGAVELYYDNSLKLDVKSWGVEINGDLGLDDNRKVALGNGPDLEIYHNGTDSYVSNSTNNLRIGNTHSNNIKFFTNNSVRWNISGDGTFLPDSNNAYDIGTSSYRVRNIYTNDLNLSNQGSSNDVDGTWGDWTIQEGENDLFLKNNRSGKKYKFNLTEVS
jgi:hypothetical protein